jgi:hypothetical protein
MSALVQRRALVGQPSRARPQRAGPRATFWLGRSRPCSIAIWPPWPLLAQWPGILFNFQVNSNLLQTFKIHRKFILCPKIMKSVLLSFKIQDISNKNIKFNRGLELNGLK